MLRLTAIAVTVGLVLPNLAAAQPAPNSPWKPGVVKPGGTGRPGGAVHPGGAPHGSFVAPGGTRARVGGPPMHGGVGGGRQFSFHGQNFNRVHLAPFVYPRGFGYRRWAPGLILPAVFLVPAYYYANWAALGVSPPPPGFQWVRYGPDLVLVDVNTGQITDVVYGVFY
jgi:hypothetical protein